MQTTQTSQSAQTAPTSQGAQTAHWLADALAVRAGCVDRSVIDAALVGISRLIAVLESQRLVCASALRQLSPVPQRDLAVGPWLDGRDASGVRAMRLEDGETVVAVAPVFTESEDVAKVAPPTLPFDEAPDPG